MTSAKPPLRVLVFDASLGSASLNDRLATLVASAVGERDRGPGLDVEFDSPS
jgi:hypothetical protein